MAFPASLKGRSHGSPGASPIPCGVSEAVPDSYSLEQSGKRGKSLSCVHFENPVAASALKDKGQEGLGSLLPRVQKQKTPGRLSEWNLRAQVVLG